MSNSNKCESAYDPWRIRSFSSANNNATFPSRVLNTGVSAPRDKKKTYKYET